MKQNNDYVAGPHHYWIHFVCGFFFGAIVGASLGNWIFDAKGLVVVSALALALFFAFTCGKWGDKGWEMLSDWFHTW